MMEENNSMEGYLQKRFQTGIVKSMKKKWFLLKDGELRCYQNEDACKRNAEMYQDVVQVNDIQTVRIASEKHGAEVVTKQKKFILVASSEEDQKKWIKAIYEALKDNRPRSVSTPTEKRSPARKISASKFGLPHMFTFNRKSFDDETQQTETQSLFYVHPATAEPSPSQSEVGVQADVGPALNDQITQSSTSAEIKRDSDTITERAEGLHLMDGPEQEDSSSVECKPKETTDNSIVSDGQVDSQNTPCTKPCPDKQVGLDPVWVKRDEVNGNMAITEAGKESEPCFDTIVPSDNSDAECQDQIDTLVQTTGSLSLNEPQRETKTLDDEDEVETVTEAKKERGMDELQALLKSLSEGVFSDCDGVFSSDDQEPISVGSDDESETTQKGTSAFDQLQELLKG
ncbi:uncharacterized protein [Asterias amurensis]|uniref:uncharacterized protein isoform X1 n=1 Tax=Asterias amurensis TaxID=7602 RepID=UPI003AB3AAD7